MEDYYPIYNRQNLHNLIVLNIIITRYWRKDLKENKQMSSTFYIGASLIIVSVLSYPFLKNRYAKEDFQIKKAEKL